MRVRNIFICAGVAFCASSSSTKALRQERPRITSNGASSIAPFLRAMSKTPEPMRSRKASSTGAAQGANLSSSEPGKKPRERPQGALGRVMMMRAICPAR
jgi:hypothetical protein